MIRKPVNLPRITSSKNPHLQRVRRLYDKNYRMREKSFVVDNPRDLERALLAGYECEFALICEELLATEADILGRLPLERCFAISTKLMTRAGYRQNPSGLVGVMRQPTNPQWNSQLATVNTILVMVGLRIPGNIGALLRSADALGLSAAILVDSPLDLYNPNLIRSSTGACFIIDVVSLQTADALEKLRSAGYSLVAAAVDGEAWIYDTALPEKLAIILGAEDGGLDSRWLNAADLRLRIPMHGGAADSLNVAACGAILIYEASRQKIARGVAQS